MHNVGYGLRTNQGKTEEIDEESCESSIIIIEMNKTRRSEVRTL